MLKFLSICIFFILALAQLGICQTCEPVTNLSGEQINPHLIRFFWNPVPGSYQYKFEYKPTIPDTFSWNTKYVKDTTSMAILSLNKEYKVRVWSFCSPNQSSAYPDSFTFNLNYCCNMPPIYLDSTGYRFARLRLWPIENAEKYEFQYQKFGDTTWTRIITQDIVAKLDNLDPKVLYRCRVRTKCKNGIYSIFSWGTDFNVYGCLTPINIKIDSMEFTSAFVKWDDVSYSKKFLIEYRPEGDSVWQTARVQNAYIKLNQLSEGTVYQVRVKTICAKDSSEYSKIVRFKTKGNGCFWPSNIKVDSMNLTTASLHWEPEPMTTLYLVEYNKWQDTIWNTTQTVNSFIKLTQLSPRTIYLLRIRSKCKENKLSTYSDTIVFRTPYCNPSFDPKVGSVSYTTANLSWENGYNAMQYLVEYKPKDDTIWLSTQTQNTQITLTQLLSGTTYQCRMRSKCAEGAFSDDFYIVFKTLQYECLKPTKITLGKIEDIMANLSWSSTPFATEYQIEYKPKTESTWQTTQTQNNYITLNQLTPLIVYQYRMKTKCERNDFSPYSDTIEFKTMCAIPTNVNYKLNSSTSVTVNWDSIPNSDGYILLYKLDTDSDWIGIDTKNNSQIIDNLDPGTVYDCRVRNLCDKGVFFSHSKTIQFRTWALGIPDEADKPGILLSPNPARDFISIRMDSEENGVAKMELYSIAGIKIASYPLAIHTDTVISTIDLSAGVYLCKFLVNDKWVGTQKLIIVR